LKTLRRKEKLLSGDPPHQEEFFSHLMGLRGYLRGRFNKGKKSHKFLSESPGANIIEKGGVSSGLDSEGYRNNQGKKDAYFCREGGGDVSLQLGGPRQKRFCFLVPSKVGAR